MPSTRFAAGSAPSFTPHSPPDLVQLHGAAAQAVGLLKLLANEDRLLLLCQLSQGECCVSGLELQLGIRQPTLSQQLGVLRSHQVVNTRREGKNIYYSVASPELMEILGLLHRIYCPRDPLGIHVEIGPEITTEIAA